MACPTTVGYGLLVRLIAFAEDMIVVGGMKEGVSLVVPEKNDGVGAMDDQAQL